MKYGAMVVLALAVLLLSTAVFGQEEQVWGVFEYMNYTLPGEEFGMDVCAGSYLDRAELDPYQIIAAQADVQLPRGFKVTGIKETDLTRGWNFLYNCIDSVDNVWRLGGFYPIAIQGSGKIMELLITTPTGIELPSEYQVRFFNILLNNLKSVDKVSYIKVDHVDLAGHNFPEAGWYTFGVPQPFWGSGFVWPDAFLPYTYTNGKGYEIASSAQPCIGYMVYIPYPTGWGLEGRAVSTYTKDVQEGWEPIEGLSRRITMREIVSSNPVIDDSLWVMVAGQWHKTDTLEPNQAGFLRCRGYARLFIGYPPIPFMPLGKTMGGGDWNDFNKKFGATPPGIAEARVMYFKRDSTIVTAAPKNYVGLTWETMWEAGNLGHEVYRSDNGGKWNKITKRLIDGLGSREFGRKYFFADSTLFGVAGTFSYKVGSVGYNGVVDTFKTVVTVTLDRTTGVATNVVQPDGYILEQNYPNPFNPSTTIGYQLPTAESVELAVYNLRGQLVRTLVASELQSAGAHLMQWDGRDQYGQQVAAGMYVYTIRAGSFTASRKMLFAK